MRRLPILFLLILIFCQWNITPALGASESLEAKVKKIIMMLNIVAREYKEGIAQGEIINAVEYEESQVFLEQAFGRFKFLPPPPGNIQEIEILQNRFTELTRNLKSKVDPSEVRPAINLITTQLMNLYGIEIHKAPATPVSLENGRKVFENSCSVCHGLSGKGNGPIASQFDPPPAVLADPNITGDNNTKAYDNFQVISVGIANTAMVGWADTLSEADLWDVTYYIRTFSNKNVQLPLVAGAAADGAAGGKIAEKVVAETRGLLDKSLDAYKKGDIDKAADLAFDAYLTYEKIESGLISKRKKLGLKLESTFGRYHAEIKRGAPLSHVEKIYSAINQDLTRALETLKEELGFAGLFIQSFSIIVREGFEAILIIAALIAFMKKSRNQDKLKSIYAGVLIGIAGSFLTAYLLHEVFNITVASQELMEGWIMLVAVVVLFWVSYWLVSKIEAEKWQSYITGKMKSAISTGSVLALGGVAFLSVYREGFETVLFYKALYLYAGAGTQGILPGFLAGCVLLAVIYYLFNRLGVRIPIKWFFAVTSIFLYYMAFTFMGKGLHELQMGSQLSMTPAHFIPEISWMGVYPTWETFAGQALLAAAYIFALVYTFGIKPEVETQHLKQETSNIQKDISAVHDLVEHISHHAKRCEIFLKDTRDQDLKELSDHLREIDTKVHELFDHVAFMENQLQDEYERLGRKGFSVEEKKGLS